MGKLRNLVMFFLLSFLTACGEKEVENLPVYQTMDDLKGKKIGVITGAFQEALLEKEYPEVEVLRFDLDTDMIQALFAKRCDALVMDNHIFLYHTQNLKGIKTLDSPLVTAEMGVCFGKGQHVELRQQFNEYLKKIKADGTYDEIYNRWMYHADEAEMPEIQMPEGGEPIRVATNSTAPPLVFIKEGKLVGHDIELANRFAASIGRRIEWSDMNFSALIPALVSGNYDMIVSGVNITPAREESIDFSDSYFSCSILIGIREENSVGYVKGVNDGASTGFVESIKTGIQRNIIEEDRYLMIFEGLKISAIISLLSGLFGTLLGALICWMRMSSYAVIRRFAGLYISLMRGTPVLVLLMIMFYVVFAGTSVDAVMVSVITFGMNFAAYVSEMFRSSIESVDRGQTEAGIALGFSPVKTFCYIVMPQAFKQVLPVYKGELISLVKMTSIVGYIAVQDLTKVGDIIRSRTFDAFFPLVMVAILYFVLSWIFAEILNLIGKKVS